MCGVWFLSYWKMIMSFLTPADKKFWGGHTYQVLHISLTHVFLWDLWIIYYMIYWLDLFIYLGLHSTQPLALAGVLINIVSRLIVDRKFQITGTVAVKEGALRATKWSHLWHLTRNHGRIIQSQILFFRFLLHFSLVPMFRAPMWYIIFHAPSESGLGKWSKRCVS